MTISKRVGEVVTTLQSDFMGFGDFVISSLKSPENIKLDDKIKATYQATRLLTSIAMVGGSLRTLSGIGIVVLGGSTMPLITALAFTFLGYEAFKVVKNLEVNHIALSCLEKMLASKTVQNTTIFGVHLQDLGVDAALKMIFAGTISEELWIWEFRHLINLYKSV